ADGNAVQELLPAVKLLYEAGKQLPADDVNAHWNAIKTKLNTKMQEIRIARQLSTQLPQTGAALHDLLGKELYCRNVSFIGCSNPHLSSPGSGATKPAWRQDLADISIFVKPKLQLDKHTPLGQKEQRSRAVSRAIPLAEAEHTIQQSIEAIVADTGDITNKLANVANDESALDEKIERKKREYEQMQKRFVKLQSFRPQYMDEYEKLEAKLKQLYEVYVVKFRNLAYLQQLQLEIERTDRQKQEESERTMRQVVEKMRMELNN
ncbi:hypothetical protein TELCIR_20974, partial [Teladorsagia circumcincta]